MQGQEDCSYDPVLEVISAFAALEPCPFFDRQTVSITGFTVMRKFLSLKVFIAGPNFGGGACETIPIRHARLKADESHLGVHFGGAWFWTSGTAFVRDTKSTRQKGLLFNNAQLFEPFIDLFFRHKST